MLANNKAIVTLTTIPERLLDTHYGESGVYSCIKSLCEQTYENYEIHFNVPDYYKLRQTTYEIPDWLIGLQNNFDKLKIFRVQDVGPSTKILPTIQRIEQSECVIIVVDDDMVYRDALVEEHIKNQNRIQNCAIGYDGLGILEECEYTDSRNHYVSMVKKDTRVKVLQHYKSVSYKRSFFEEDLFTNFVGKTNSDDILISAYMGYKNVKKIVARYDHDDHQDNFEIWLQKVGRSFPIIRPISHDNFQGCTDPNAQERFYRPQEFLNMGYLER